MMIKTNGPASPDRKLGLYLYLLILLALALGACEQETREPPPATATAATEPAEAVAPTATPLPLPAPRLLYHSPARGEEQPLDAPVELIFDQPMDRASVEAAFAISPTLDGAFVWDDERTMTFVAAGGLERATPYRVTVAETARNTEGTLLAEATGFDFSTVGALRVSQVIPAPGSDELDPDTTVTVIFDRPVVPLAAINQQGELPDPLTFMPPVRGEGEWLNTSIYVFRPEEGLLPATDYRVRVAAGLTGTSGSVLEEDYRWEFSTLRPKVLGHQPPKRFAHVGPSSVISVTFNQPMDHASVMERFSLEREGEGVKGTFRWQGGETPITPETMVFVPAQPLSRDTDFSARVGKGAQAREGKVGTARETAWTFGTVQLPGVTGSSPRDGEEEVEPDGSVRIRFASPMQRAGFLEHLTIRPEATAVYTYWSEFDTEVHLRFRQEPATAYTLSLDGDTPDRYGAKLGQTATIRFTTGDLVPYAVLSTSGRVSTFGTYTDTVVFAAYRNVSRLDASLYRVSVRTFAELNSSWNAWNGYAPEEEDLVRRWSRRVKAPRNEEARSRFELLDGEGNPLPPGLYYIELTAPEVKVPPDTKPSRTLFIKSRLNLTMKQTHGEALVWATDLATGQPVVGLPVALYAETSRLASGGRTGIDGLYLAKGLEIESLWEPFFAVTGKPGEADFGIAYSDWDKGISPWDFGTASEFWASKYRGILYTDRPIYRPGQTVLFKGIVRADDDAHYRLPQEPAPGSVEGMESVELLIQDPTGKELVEKELALNDMGSLHDALLLDEEAPLGYYHMEIRAPDQEFYAGTSFQVAEYRKPEYQVAVSTDREGYLSGEAIEVGAEASYYFGGPVAGADVHWSVLSSDYGFRYRCPASLRCPWYSWSDYEWGSFEAESSYGNYGQLITEGEAQTDDEGRLSWQVPADIAGESQSQIFTMEASVADLSGQEVSQRTATVVHKGAFYAGVAPRGYLARVGEEKQVDLLTVDWDSEPVADVPLTVVFMEHRWYSVRRQAEDGRFYWDWSSEDVPVFTTTVTSGDDGQAVVTFRPEKAGSYRVRASGLDTRGNEVRSAAYFWVWGGDGYVRWRQESNNRIELIADKEEYQVGDVAEILVPSPYSGTVQALVTTERGHILSSENRELTSNSEVLRVPIGEEHVPSLFVSVILVQGAEQAADGLATFRMGVAELPVSVESKELEITLTPDKDMAQSEHYGPRETATYDVMVKDREGRPVEAELSLRLADLAALALADEPGPTLLETFWRGRGLGVRTSTPLVVAMEAFNRELKPRAKGGGGGDGEGMVRSRFADTAFWDPVVRTGKDGQAEVTVQLPDNLTTWRMQARGITAGTAVGRAEVDVLSTLDLLVRPVLPRFFVVGDEAEIATLVHNNTAAALQVEVNITAEGLSLEGEASQTARIPPREKAKVTWPVKALPGEEVRVHMWARADDDASGSGRVLYDAREDTLPVYRYSTPEVVATSGHLAAPGLRQEIIQPPPVLDPSQGDLTVQIDGSLTAASQDALRYLEHYPYECTEQTVSRFLPNVVTWQALEELGMEGPGSDPQLRQKLAQMVGTALQRLYAQQHYDGGWGWWVTDESDPYLTAYALQGMLEAHRAGFVVDGAAMAKAAGYVHSHLPSVSRVDSRREANRLAYQLYVLAEYGTTIDQESGGELGLAIRLFEKRHLLDHYGQATLAVALGLLEGEEAGRVETLLGDLAGDAITSATGTHWEETEPDYWNMNTDIRTTGIVLWALSRLEADSELLPNTVRWLMAARQEGHWETTQATAWSLLGLVEYMRASGELAGDFSYRVTLNGDDLASGTVSKETIDESHKLQIEIARLLADGSAADTRSGGGNRLVVERHAAQPGQTGEGQLYYSAYLRYFLPADHVQALDRGILVARQYSPADNPDRYVDSAQVGDVIQVKLTIVSPTDLHYVVVEDPLPAGFEGVDQSLKTTSVVGEPPELRSLTAEEESHWYRRHGWGWWWFSHSEMRDEKVALFAQYLPRGTYEYTYLMRASVPGEFLTMPATAYEMYFPEVFGRSDGGKFVVEAGGQE